MELTNRSHCINYTIIDRSFKRFVMSLCIPALVLFLHTIRASLQSNENRVFKAFDKRQHRRPAWKRASLWIRISRVWLPVGYFVVASAILLPGIINVTLLNTYNKI